MEREKQETMDLRAVFTFLKKHLIFLIIFSVLGAGVAAVYSFFIASPTYESTSQIVVRSTVSEEQSALNAANVQANIQSTSTYNQILVSPTILNPVIKDLGLSQTAAQLQSQMSVTSATNSQVMVLIVKDGNPYRASDIANATAKEFKAKLGTIMNIDNVSILSQAVPDTSPVSPNKKLNLLIGFVVGLLISVGIVFLIESLDTTVKSQEDMSAWLGKPVMGIIPNISDKKNNKRNEKSKHVRQVKAVGGKNV